ncbi:hypothetical protein SRB5_27580 [Streptomyces sp. RB5]|uniref:eCIS core domain-containing protein n=1 Tax=Streptomyces smaragdinus TaxID=2585196 RepID=A0A7K0CI15_9ACTN|nr:DUF4157 domain-containing protein [Streptomyces smaragdinus]MQY12622.1 hypothetical protein [Streptomyces smaragdinus]
MPGFESEARRFARAARTPARAAAPGPAAPLRKPPVRVPGGAPLPVHLREPLERRTGADLGPVRVHRTPERLRRDAPRLPAFTVGHDIVSPGGLYDFTGAGSERLAHEIAHVVQQSGGASRPGLSSAASPGTVVAQGDGGLSEQDTEAIRAWLAQGGGNTGAQPPASGPWQWPAPGAAQPARGSTTVICNVNCHQTADEQRQEAERRAAEQRRRQEEQHQAALRAGWPGLHRAGHGAELDRQATTVQGDIDASRQAEAQLRLQLFDRALAAGRGALPGAGSRFSPRTKDSWARAEQAAVVLEAVFRASAGQDAPAAVTDPLRPWFVAFYASVSALFRGLDVAEQRLASQPSGPRRPGQSPCPSGCHASASDQRRDLASGAAPWATLPPVHPSWPGTGTPAAGPDRVPDKDLPAGRRETRLLTAVNAVQDARDRAGWRTALGEFRWATRQLDDLLLADLRAAGGSKDLVESFEYTRELHERQAAFLLAHPHALKVQAVFYPKEDVSEKTDETGRPRPVARAIPWQFYLVRTPEPTSERTVPTGFEWQLHDLTAPRRDKRYVRTRHQVNAIEGLSRERFDPAPIMRMPVPPKIFEELDNEDFFPEGHLYWRDPVTNAPGGMATTAPTSFWTWLGRIGLGVAVLGSLVFAPLSTPFLVTAALGTGIKLAAGYARLREKQEHGVWTQADTDQFHWELAQDILSAVTLGVGRMGVVAAEAGALARAASATRVWFVLRRLEAGSQLVNIAVTGHDLIKQFAAIQEAVRAGKMTRAQADAAYGRLALMATGTGLLSIVQFRGAVKDLTGRPALLLSPDPQAPGRMVATIEVLPAARRALKTSANLTSRQLAHRPADLRNEFEVVKASPMRVLSGGEYDFEVILTNGHVWRKRRTGQWCRFSDDPLCFLFDEGGGAHVQEIAKYRVARRGEWSGEPGNSDFTPNNRDALVRAGYRPIPYVNDHPVFTDFAVGTVLLRRADLAVKDRRLHDRLADQAYARQQGWFRPGTTTPDAGRVAALRSDPADPLTWHHVEGDNIMLLVPRSIHQAAQHSGGFAED